MRCTCRSFKLLAQLEFLDLAGTGFRQVAEYHPGWALEVRQLVTTVTQQLCLGRRFASGELNESNRSLAPLVMVIRDHRDGTDGGMLIQRRFNLDGRDVLTA